MSDDSPAARTARLRLALTAPGALFETVDDDVRGHRMPVFRHRARTLRELLERSARFGDRAYLVDGDVRLTFGAHLAMADAVAAGLQTDFGIAPGDRVAIFAANRWEWVVAYWALVSIGAIPAAFNGWWTAEEYEHAAGLVEPVLVIGDAARLARTAGGTPRRVLDLDDLVGVAGAHEGEHPVVPPLVEDEPAVLFFTSGTTGRAKAVTVPHRALVGFVQLNTFGDSMARVAMGGPVPQAGDELPAGDEVVLVTSPLFHTSMLNGVVLNAVVTGTSFVLLPGRFDPERVLAAIEHERVTRWLALGSAGPRVVESPALGKYDTSSIRTLGVGGAPVSPAVQNALRGAFPSARSAVGMGYTSTEGGAVIANIGGPEFVAHPTSTGRITVTTQVELRDETGSAVAEGEYGEVHVRSPYLMLGYWNDPVATAAALKPDGWLAMGDIARFEDGLLYIDSRARDMILVSAENVSPTEVEYCLESHPDVIEAAVFAVDDPMTGDAVCAAVTLRAGARTADAELRAWCERELAPFKVPTRWMLLTGPLPRTASGKLLKHELRERAGRPDSDLAVRDRAVAWHPYAAMPSALPAVPVRSGSGARLELTDGRTVIDAMSSWWAAIHGYRHPVLDAAVVEQLGDLSHVMFGGLTHRPAVELAELLVSITPEPLQHVFFTDSGSIAVEVAIKMAIQYWLGRGIEGRHRLLTVRSGYHGDTLAAMSVCDPVTGMHHMFASVLPQQLFAPAPSPAFGDTFDHSHVAEFAALLEQHAHEVAAVILEPVVQGAGGMRFYAPEYLTAVRALCDRYGVLLIADEIATGFGRSGRLFGCDHAGIAPDIMCVGKALTGGYLTMAATLCTTEVASGVSAAESGALMHGPTFMANPLAASVALASTRLLLSQPWEENVARIERRLREGLAPAVDVAQVADVRVLGAIGVIELERPLSMSAMQEVGLTHGVWLRPFGRLVYTMPPYVATNAELDQICRAMVAIATGVTEPAS